MFQVGDAATHTAYLKALTASHGYGCRVECWLAGALQGEVPFESGLVRVDATNRERRSIDNLLVPERFWPSGASDMLTPFGAWLRILATITAGSSTFPEIPVFSGPLLAPRRDRYSGRLVIRAADPMWQINQAAFETPRTARRGNQIVAVITSLILEVLPAASVEDQTGSVATVPGAGIVWDAAKGSRGRAIDELAAAIGAEVIAVPGEVYPGGTFVIRPIPTLADTPAWNLVDGAAGVVDRDIVELSREDVINRWVVPVERTDGSPPLYATATDDDPNSPTRYGGPMGKLVDFWSSPLVTTVAQAQAAAQAKLARSLGLARQRAVTAVTNPALEVGDVVLISVGGDPVELHIADQFEVPLQEAPATMVIGTRSTIAEP